KGLDNETNNKYIDQYHLGLKYKNQPQLSHGRIAAERVKREQGIVDEEVLDAIRYHTTGRKGMTLLEKIIYLSDAIEPTRNYPGVEKLRELAWINMDEAVIKAMDQTIYHVNKKGMELDMETVEARDDLRKKMKEKVNE
ncbi:MAG: bis(5'-nucleosyl)-tetraphosphatase (symmetrical) YqeK, partial [Anaerovoracaceae bacterium]